VPCRQGGQKRLTKTPRLPQIRQGTRGKRTCSRYSRTVVNSAATR
jgi:hypothetical protein